MADELNMTVPGKNASSGCAADSLRGFAPSLFKSPLSSSLVAALILCVLMFACEQNSSRQPTNQRDRGRVPDPSSPDELQIEPLQVAVVDFAGNTVSLATPAKKIVALAPHVAENVFTAGAGDALVGVVEHSNYPKQAQSVAVVGGYQSINLETIIELNPDLIIAWRSGNSGNNVKRLIELGFSVYIDQPDTLVDIAKSIRDIGLLSGNSQTAEKAASDYLYKLNHIVQRYRDVPRVSTFYQVWHRPLQTINGSHIISEAIETCGGINIYANEFAVAPIVNIESVLQRNPGAIIVGGASSTRSTWQTEWQQWDSLAAVKEGNLLYVNPDHLQRHTVRLLQGIESLCAQLDGVRARMG